MSKKTYTIGMKFKVDGWHSNGYMLCQVYPYTCALISLDSGNGLSDPKVVLDVGKITTSELRSMVGSKDKITKI